MLDKALNKIKKITGIAKFDDSKVVIDRDNTLLDDIILKQALIFLLYITKGDSKSIVYKIRMKKKLIIYFIDKKQYKFIGIASSKINMLKVHLHYNFFANHFFNYTSVC